MIEINFDKFEEEVKGENLWVVLLLMSGNCGACKNAKRLLNITYPKIEELGVKVLTMNVDIPPNMNYMMSNYPPLKKPAYYFFFRGEKVAVSIPPLENSKLVDLVKKITGIKDQPNLEE